MPAGGYGEDALVEQPAMALLGDLGWETLSGYDEHPGSGGPIGRTTFTETIIETRLRSALRSVNPGGHRLGTHPRRRPPRPRTRRRIRR